MKRLPHVSDEVLRISMYALTGIAALLVVAVVVAQFQILHLAGQGNAARQRQITTAPVSCVLVNDLYAREKISYPQLANYVLTLPGSCLIPPPPQVNAP